MLALVTSQSARSLDTDLPLLLDAFVELEVDVEIAAWDDPDVDWSRYDAAVLRSTWDYHRRLEAFDQWLERVAAVTTLWNPLSLVRWNLDKRYLLEVASWGVPIVPTLAVADVAELDDAVIRESVVGDVVVKPAIGAGANGARRIIDDPQAALGHARALLDAGSTALIQPYVTAVDTRGETGIVTVGGRVSHAFGKAAILTGEPEWADGLYVTETIDARVASATELDIAHAVMAHLPETAYARIDLLPGPDGPMVSEIELIEPSLFLHVDAGAPARAAAAFASLTSR